MTGVCVALIPIFIEQALSKKANNNISMSLRGRRWLSRTGVLPDRIETPRRSNLLLIGECLVTRGNSSESKLLLGHGTTVGGVDVGGGVFVGGSGVDVAGEWESRRGVFVGPGVLLGMGVIEGVSVGGRMGVAV